MVGWITGILNCFLLTIQLIKLWKTGSSEGIS